jgi:hypothetical protein
MTTWTPQPRLKEGAGVRMADVRNTSAIKGLIKCLTATAPLGARTSHLGALSVATRPIGRIFRLVGAYTVIDTPGGTEITWREFALRGSYSDIEPLVEIRAEEKYPYDEPNGWSISRGPSGTARPLDGWSNHQWAAISGNVCPLANAFMPLVTALVRQV